MVGKVQEYKSIRLKTFSIPPLPRPRETPSPSLLIALLLQMICADRNVCLFMSFVFHTHLAIQLQLQAVLFPAVCIATCLQDPGPATLKSFLACVFQGCRVHAGVAAGNSPRNQGFCALAALVGTHPTLLWVCCFRGRLWSPCHGAESGQQLVHLTLCSGGCAVTMQKSPL